MWFILLFLAAYVRAHSCCLRYSGQCLDTSYIPCSYHGGVYFPVDCSFAPCVDNTTFEHALIIHGQLESDNQCKADGHLSTNQLSTGSFRGSISKKKYIHNSISKKLIESNTLLYTHMKNLACIESSFKTRFSPGVYCLSRTADHDIELSGPGIYVFVSNKKKIWADGIQVTLRNGARSCDVYWIATEGVDMRANIIYGHILTPFPIKMAHSVITGSVASTMSGLFATGSSIVNCKKHEHEPFGSFVDNPILAPVVTILCSHSSFNKTHSASIISVQNKNDFTIPLMLDPIANCPNDGLLVRGSKRIVCYYPVRSSLRISVGCTRPPRTISLVSNIYTFG